MSIPRWAASHPRFDEVAARVRASDFSFDEEELLRPSLWARGDDARLREDVRFRPTPWGRWIDSSSYLANDALFVRLHREPRAHVLAALLDELRAQVGLRCTFCTADPRFVVEGDRVRLSARELSHQPLVEADVGALEKYVTHLPVHSLRAAAASAPAGEWGKRAQEDVIETLGWVRVSCDRKLNPRMFVARIEGRSMDDGRSGLVDGGLAIFELWPAGPWQHANVLVRGAFSDPETGSYAVKRYVAEPGPEGRHRRVALVSLNPDKTRFPDIELEVEREDEPVAVVARVVQPLALEQYARRPRPVRRPGRRDLRSREAVEEIEQELAEHAARFFERSPAERAAPDDAARASWSASLVCLEAEAGGLHLQVGPLLGLWSFVKQLRVRGGDWSAIVLASNARQRAVRVEVPAASGPWTWEAVGREDNDELDFSTLAAPALPSNEVVVFRVDANGVGQRLSGRTLSMGRRYRLLVPDAVLARIEQRPLVRPAGPGWSLWEVDLGEAEPALLAMIAAVGLEPGETGARLGWGPVPPVAWAQTPRGDAYPCFTREPAPVLEIDGAPIEDEGAASLYLHGPEGSEVLALPEGRGHRVRLHDLAPGRYVALLLHDRTAIAPERIAFEVVTRTPAPPAARCDVTAFGHTLPAEAGRSVRTGPHDLAGLDADSEGPDALGLRGPAGWPVRVRWRDVADDLVATVNLDAHGNGDAATVMRATYERRQRHPVADLELDFDELGLVILEHERRRDVESVRARLRELVTSRGEMAARLAGDYQQLAGIWFGPVCAELGYELGETILGEGGEPPAHACALPLLLTERRGAAIVRDAVRVMVLVEDLSVAVPEPALTWIDRICVRTRLRDVVLSDGLRWAEHRHHRRLPPRARDLRALVNDGDDLESFVRTFAEGL